MQLFANRVCFLVLKKTGPLKEHDMLIVQTLDLKKKNLPWWVLTIETSYISGLCSTMVWRSHRKKHVLPQLHPHSCYTLWENPYISSYLIVVLLFHDTYNVTGVFWGRSSLAWEIKYFR